MTLLSLAKAGYGTVTELKKLDTDDFLDMIEFEHMARDIEGHIIDKG